MPFASSLPSVCPAAAGKKAADIANCARQLRRALFGLCLLLCALPCVIPQPAWAITISDDAGNTVHFDQPARRIIGLYGAYAEILLALGLPESLVGRTAADAALPAVAHLPVVGTHMRPDPESIVALKPDLILQLAGRNEVQAQMQALQALGLNVLCFELQSFEDLFRVTQLLGQITGRTAQAAALVAGWQQRLHAIEQTLAGSKAVSVFFEVRYPNLLAAGKGSIVDDIIHRAGGVNVVQEEKKLVRLNEEALLLLKPDAYVVQHGAMNSLSEPVATRRHFALLPAVRAGRVLQVEEALFSRTGPRALDAVELLARWLHPELF